MVVAPIATRLEASVSTNDAALLDGAAALWSVVAFASDLPSTPEQQLALGSARTRLLAEIEAIGLTEEAVVAYLRERSRRDLREPGLRALVPD